MWTHLNTEYHMNSAFALVNQLGTLCPLSTEYDAQQPTSAFVQRFESVWHRLYRLASESTDNYRSKFASFLPDDKAKRDFLLGFLSRHQKNVVDNLTTKDSLSFAEVKQRLLNLGTELAPPQSAFVSSVQKGKWVPNRPNPSYGGISKRKECTFCKKHFPNQAIGYLWNNFYRLKAKNNENDALKRMFKPYGKNTDMGNATTQENKNNASRRSPLGPDL